MKMPGSTNHIRNGCNLWMRGRQGEKTPKDGVFFSLNQMPNQILQSLEMVCDEMNN